MNKSGNRHRQNPKKSAQIRKNPSTSSKIQKIKTARDNIKNKIASFNTDTHFEVIYTKIHGDFTFRNILVNSRIEFIDFDRSEFNFPEIDLFLFLNILQTYKQCKKPNYNLLFDNIFDYIDKNTVCNQVEKFYELNIYIIKIIKK